MCQEFMLNPIGLDLDQRIICPSTHLSGLNCSQGYVTKDYTAVCQDHNGDGIFAMDGLADVVDKFFCKKIVQHMACVQAAGLQSYLHKMVSLKSGTVQPGKVP